MGEGWVEENVKPVASGCCFWFRMFPPIKWFLTFMKWLFLSRMEYKVLKLARKLFKVVNADESCCSDCPYRHLSKMERMYLHRILKDQARWGSDYRQFIRTFQGQIIAMQKEESDAGEWRGAKRPLKACGYSTHCAEHC
eukprot:s2166_g2.t2